MTDGSVCTTPVHLGGAGGSAFQPITKLEG
ncbi:hypothetical protein SBA6_950009 [Candidatus Sulfopaludibacter sp. SbA6]|nr:hypothetical protein SBA6_950009 [Candidatus Sulfopaludibacter sp. SbA6]